MKFSELEIPGVWLIEPDLVCDNRGVFRRHFCAREFSARGLAVSVAQANVSENPYLHTLRGFHYQLAPYSEGKTISCLMGGLYDIVVDLRPESRCYLQWVAVSIDATNRASLHVPAGCANAYLTMQENTIVHYYMSEFYVPESYRGFRYDDPNFDFRWPATPKVISIKDQNLPAYRDAKTQGGV